MAPVAGSGATPSWMALVANFMNKFFPKVVKGLEFRSVDWGSKSELQNFEFDCFEP